MTKLSGPDDASPACRQPAAAALSAELVAVVLTVDGAPQVLASGTPAALPAGPLRTDHQSLQTGTRAFVREQTGYELGHIEQLYTFADLGRSSTRGRTISISYLGLTRAASDAPGWASVYDLLPWEDRRSPVSTELAGSLAKSLSTYAGRGAGRAQRAERRDHLFGLRSHPWRPELALQRYELLWEAGLVAESPSATGELVTGERMRDDHRRILATALSRLRATMQYRPVAFELMPASFTLGSLQEVVEAVAGQSLHKQNFRRAVEQQQLVEPTGQMTHATGGRPARLYRFRPDVVQERAQAGTKLPLPRR